MMKIELTTEQAQFVAHAMTTMKNLSGDQWSMIHTAASVVMAIEAGARAEQEERAKAAAEREAAAQKEREEAAQKRRSRRQAAAQKKREKPKAEE